MSLSVENLSVQYGAVHAVRSLCLDASAGGVLAVLGANGAGKTSTLRGIMGLEKQVSGRVELHGTAITGWKTERIAKAGLALVPQGRRIFGSLSVEENLYLGGYRQSSRMAVRRMLAECYEMFPVLAERRQQKAGYLSGGEQQMLAFGRALMAKPSVILMDEPSMGLAPIFVTRIMDTVRNIANSGIAVLIVEQNAMAALRIADNVVVLELGTEVFRGTVADVRNDEALVKAFLGEAAVEAPGMPDNGRSVK